MKYLVATATYNEADTIEELVKAVNHDMLVVDDSSTDGTAELLKKLGVTTITRPRKLGIGSAHLLAMQYAVDKGYDALVTLDADLSHNPKDIPRLLEELEGADFVIGSRFCEGGECRYPASRVYISKAANYLARFLLGIDLHETTTSFRAFTIETVKKLLRCPTNRTSYTFFFSVTHFCNRLGLKMKEVPIIFEDRRAGSSKIRKSDIIRSIFRLFILFVYPVKLKKPLENAPCINCGSKYLALVYDGRGEKSDKINVSCTGAVHRSHGDIKDCLVCGLRQINPVTPDVEKLYEEVEDQTYLENIPAKEKTFLENWDKIKNVVPQKGKLLDVGCYCGVWSNLASEKGFNVTGVDPSRWATNYAKEHYGLDVVQGSVPDVKGKFDIVTSWDVLEHVTSPPEFLSEINKKLKPKGYFAFSTVLIDSLFARTLGSRWPWYVDMHLSYFTRQNLTQILSDAGFNVIVRTNYTHITKLDYLAGKLKKNNFIPDFVADVLDRDDMFVPVSMGDVCLWVCQKKPS